MRWMWAFALMWGCEGSIVFGDKDDSGTDTATSSSSSGTTGTTSSGTSSTGTTTRTTDTTSKPAANPALPGDFEVYVDTVDIDIGPRQGEAEPVVETRVYLPRGAKGGSPVIVFNHGFNMGPADYASYGQHLASHGFAVLMPRWDEGLFSSRTHVELAADLNQMVDWLDRVDGAQAKLAEAIDASRVGLAGHSRGGKQAIQSGLSRDDVGAIFTVDPVDSAPPGGFFDDRDYPSMTPERIGDLTVPFGMIGAGLGSEGFVPCAPESDNFEQYYIHSSSPVWLYVFPEAGHQDFTDPCADAPSVVSCSTCSYSDQPARYRDLAPILMVPFFQLHLNGVVGYQDWVDAPEEAIEDVPILVTHK